LLFNFYLGLRSDLTPWILITGINFKKINIYIMVYHRKMDISTRVEILHHRYFSFYGINCKLSFLASSSLIQLPYILAIILFNVKFFLVIFMD